MAGLLRPAGITTQRFGPSEVPQEPPGYSLGDASGPLRAAKSSFPGATYSGDKGHVHRGVDMRTKRDRSNPNAPANGIGLELPACEAGTVVSRATDGFGGQYIGVKIRDGTTFWYWHVSEYAAGMDIGAEVSRGQTIAKSGKTGLTDGGAHLHFELRIEERGGDGVIRSIHFNPERFCVGGDLATDPRILPPGGIGVPLMFPKVISISLGGPRVWDLPPGKTLALFDPAQPGITVTSFVGPTSAETDELQDVLWFDTGGVLADISRWPVPGGFHPSTGRTGAFARISNGPFAGLLFVTANAVDRTGLNFGPLPARGRGRGATAAAFKQGFDEAKAKAVTEIELATEKVKAL